MAKQSRHARFLWTYITDWKWQIASALVALSFVSVTTLVYPWLLKMMVDGFEQSSVAMGGLLWIAAGLLMLFLISTVSGYYQQLTMHDLGYQLRNRLRRDLYKNLLHRPLDFHRNQQVGELSARATEDIGKIQPVFTSLIAPVFQNVLVVSGGVALTLFLNWGAALVLIAFIMLPFPFILRYSRKIRSLAAQSRADHATANACFEETLVAIREVKAFARESIELKRYLKFMADAFRNEMGASRLVIRGNQSAYFFLSAMLLTMFYLAAIAALPGWTLGSMVAFYFYSYTIAMALLSIGRIYLTYQNVTAALERVQDLMRGMPGTDASSPGHFTGKLSGKVFFRDVSFSYNPGKPILRGVSFRINKGEWIVIGGPSGSGKSTVANLLMGFYEPQDGEILLGGTSLIDWDKSSLRRQMGYVGQDPMLFHGTVRENFLVSGSPPANGAIDEILRITCLEETVSELPQGLETTVGERGYTLSGGQKARLAIARALLANPEILVLDEANAMLEAELEQELWKNLLEFSQGKTVLVLTHHHEHIPKIYRFLRLESGKIVE